MEQDEFEHVESLREQNNLKKKLYKINLTKV